MIDNRRFSFSIPVFDPLYDGDGSTEEDSVFGCFGKFDEEMEAETKAAEDNCIVKLDLADPISKLVHAGRDKCQFAIPPKSAIDARVIWESAGISACASYNEIDAKLLRWAIRESKFEIVKGQTVVKWKTHGGCTCSCGWTSFVRWILCASLTKLSQTKGRS